MAVVADAMACHNTMDPDAAVHLSITKSDLDPSFIDLKLFVPVCSEFHNAARWPECGVTADTINYFITPH